MIDGITIKSEGIIFNVSEGNAFIPIDKARELYEDLKKLFGGASPPPIPWIPGTDLVPPYSPPWKLGDTGQAPITLLYGVRTP